MTNIVICADGTWNRPEEDIQKDYPTNVLKLARAIKPSVNDVKQHVFYDWDIVISFRTMLLMTRYSCLVLVEVLIP